MKTTILCAVLLLVPVNASAALYECDTAKRGAGGWIPDKIFVDINRAGTSAKVLDAYIKDVHGDAIDVDLSKRSDTSFQLKWKLRNVKIRNAGSGILSHAMTLDTQKLTFRMRGRLHGYDNVINGSGTCKRR